MKTKLFLFNRHPILATIPWRPFRHPSCGNPGLWSPTVRALWIYCWWAKQASERISTSYVSIFLFLLKSLLVFDYPFLIHTSFFVWWCVNSHSENQLTMSEQDDTFPGQEVEVTVSFFYLLFERKKKSRERDFLWMCLLLRCFGVSLVFIVKVDSLLWLVL